jgi:SAM-dependent methyltransferase
MWSEQERSDLSGTSRETLVGTGKRTMTVRRPEQGSMDLFAAEDFERTNEDPDSTFYAQPRFVQHLDSLALSTVEALYARLIPRGAAVLDLMAGPDSHIPPEVEPASVTGLGLNHEELAANPILSHRLIHDINAEPRLPFDDGVFDVVLNTVSVDYIVHPVEILREVARVLRPRGLFVVVFSNRMFPPKAVNIWKAAGESARVDLVKKFFSLSGRFTMEGGFESKGKPRPKDDKYYSFGIPSDPIYAVWGKVKE